MKNPKLSAEDKLLNRIIKDRERAEKLSIKAHNKAERDKLKIEKDALKSLPKKPKEVPSEKQLVHNYVNRIIKNQEYHGRIDPSKFEGLKQQRTVNKDLWKDTEFYFSVVFQSTEQKYQVLDALQKLFNLEVDLYEKITIVNGLSLAKSLNVPIVHESSRPYPMGSLDLLPFVLDPEDTL